MRHRLFAAIRPPAEVIEALLALEATVPGARWQDADQLHLTLRFFGELETPTAEMLAERLAEVSAEPFALALHGVGQFSRKDRVHSLWAGLAPSQPLAALQRKVEQAARRAALSPEVRRFVPHITVARLNLPNAAVLPFLQAHAALVSAPWPVAAFDLIESSLSRAGARYETIWRYRLSG